MGNGFRIPNRGINDIHGIVKTVSKDKTQIVIDFPAGGSIIAKNEGFNVGDKVCLITSSIGKILRVIPRDIADLINTMGTHPMIKAAMVPPPENVETEIESEDILEEITQYTEEEEDDDEPDFCYRDIKELE
jgi:hypothetical protein